MESKEITGYEVQYFKTRPIKVVRDLAKEYPWETLLDKTKEELEELLPDGLYVLSTGEHTEDTIAFFMATGKGGYIEFITGFDENVKKAVDNFSSGDYTGSPFRAPLSSSELIPNIKKDGNGKR